MGLNFRESTNYSDAAWSYSGFGEFRRKLAKEIGIDLDKMIGFGGKTKWNTVNNPIKYLLNHSDCDGHITALRCSLIAPRLKELIDKWDDTDYDKRAAIILANDMIKCANDNKNLEFT
jgi:hypothetical protein